MMAEKSANGGGATSASLPTLRDVMAVGFRRRHLILSIFFGIFAATLLLVLLLPKQYEAQMKLLVRHERAEPVVSPERESPVQWPTAVSEAELQSEAEFIKATDLLRKVVVVCNLQGTSSGSLWPWRRGGNEERIDRAALKLEKDLTVEPIKLTDLISVTYQSKDAQLAAKVLNSLASLYLEKHLAMRRSPGQFEFFHQQAEEYRKELLDAQEKLTGFSQAEGVVNPALEKEISVRKVAEFEAEVKGDQATIAEIRQRIATLESQLASLPTRETTEVRTSDNPQLMQTLKSKLLELELKRTELLSKFEPTYRPVQELEEQIAQAKSAIEAAEKAPLRDETTDRDPTYEALRTELAKAKTELAATEARTRAVAVLIDTYRRETEQLERKEILRQDMLRTAKTDEDNYLLYLRKEEEARISDALDRQRFSNVVVAEPATVPLRAQPRNLVFLVLGTLLAGLVSVMVGFLVDRWDPSFRTPEEVELFLGSPVLAAFPKRNE
jgi:uncharacterized protein involved in exopolysaccharide biosynthesis